MRLRSAARVSRERTNPKKLGEQAERPMDKNSGEQAKRPINKKCGIIECVTVSTLFGSSHLRAEA
jgi:hypothetical protein